MHLQDMRAAYRKGVLRSSDMASCPFVQFENWFNELLAAAKKDPSNILEPNAMVLATTSEGGAPRTRGVLLKGFSKAEGFTFFTNYSSTKAQHLCANPQCSLHFTWLNFERQVRISGSAKKTPLSVSQAYFNNRPRASQLGAWASQQSQTASSRAAIEAAYAAAEAKFKGVEHIPCPEFWGGYSVQPTQFEFWQGRESRLHDRFIYTQANGVWQLKRLMP